MLLIISCFVCCATSLWLSFVAQPKLAGSFKILASLSVVLLAYSLKLFETSPWFVTGLMFCMIGDAWLIIKGKGLAFTFGIISFMLAHVLYALAFIESGIVVNTLIFSAVVVVIFTWVLAQWLLKGLRPIHKKLVVGYLLVIGTMVSLSWSTLNQTEVTIYFGLGASLFAASDVFVAINRFKNPAFINRILGLPLYYTAQCLLTLGFYKML
ncbi:lysoplasmalogenase [Marinicella rhabdoformis]|uniref:lysoplasmalogenase n=1 Tax=Marinicella rhabdoformis TaxID=2580566 RepID=UPI0012AEC1DF|nr:lysoplasmalogenase [Marinicella rhabdoformis]